MISSLLTRAYIGVLWLYPAALRRQHGDEMVQCARLTLSHGAWRGARRLLVDTARSLPHEWLRVVRSGNPTPKRGESMRGLTRDVRYAVRLLWRSPGFTIAAALTLALGIGANTAIFSLADAALLRPIRVADPKALYSVNWSSAYPDYLAYAEHHDHFDGVIASTGTRVNAVVGGTAELVEAALVSGNYFSVLGVAPALGRVLTSIDDQRNGPTVAVIGYRWWRNRLGGDPKAIGTTIRINAVPVTIVGVAADGFRGTSVLERAQIFIPVTAAPRVQTGFFARPEMLDIRTMVWLSVTARLKPGVSPQTASAVLDATYRQFHPPEPGRPRDTIELKPLRALGRHDTSVYRFVGLLAMVVALTLLIGCSNLATLLLSRAAARRKEIGIRMAIGAGRGSIARQLLVESLLLSVLGGTAGLAVAAAGLRILERFQLPGGIEIEGLDLGLSWTVLGFTALIALGTGVLFGMAPAWRASRTDVLRSLREESRATSARSSLRATLVATQVALSLVLLIGTGLFLRSLVNVLRVPLGFNVARVATAAVNLGAARYSPARAKVFYDEALGKVRHLPGVTSVAWSTLVPINGSRMFDATVDGYRPQPQEEVYLYTSAVGPEYFQTAGTRVLKGRTFSTSDSASSPLVGIVNTAAVHQVLERPRPAERSYPRRRDLDSDRRCRRRRQDPGARRGAHPVHLPAVRAGKRGRTAGSGAPVRPDERRRDRAARTAAGRAQKPGPRRAGLHVTTFAWRVRQLIMPQQMGGTLFGVFSSLAVVLAAIGIYGVASYVAALRTREIGIGIALGADRSRIRTMVIRDGIGPVVAGVVAGLVLAWLGSGLAGSFLRGVTPYNPLTYAAVTLFFGCVAMAATWIPARRAAQLEPMSALRQT